MASTRVSSTPVVTAEYNSPTNSENFQLSQPALDNAGAVSETTVYLSGLRQSVAHMQSTINDFLTKRMDEDNRAAADLEGHGIAVDEQKEEDNYGEEVEDDEA